MPLDGSAWTSRRAHARQQGAISAGYADQLRKSLLWVDQVVEHERGGAIVDCVVP
jgi:hypothetical protein